MGVYSDNLRFVPVEEGHKDPRQSHSLRVGGGRLPGCRLAYESLDRIPSGHGVDDADPQVAEFVRIDGRVGCDVSPLIKDSKVDEAADCAIQGLIALSGSQPA